jgi:hypothetical protein
MKFLILALVASLPLASLARAEEAKPAADAAHHEAEAGHDHKHGKKCGHKAEKHGDHTDYHHDEAGKAHHHKAHGAHYDECDGPEGETKEAAKK